MSKEGTDSSSGATQLAAGGAAENESQNQQSVAYETHRKLLGEKKKRDEDLDAARKQIAEFQAKEKERDELGLKEKENFKGLLEIREKELAEVKQSLAHKERVLENGMKLDAFTRALSGKLADEYYPLVDLDAIKTDPATGMPDAGSVQAAAKAFETRYTRVIERGTGARLPNDAARGGNGKLSREEWLKLPSKEMKARLKDVLA